MNLRNPAHHDIQGFRGMRRGNEELSATRRCRKIYSVTKVFEHDVRVRSRKSERIHSNNYRIPVPREVDRFRQNLDRQTVPWNIRIRLPEVQAWRKLFLSQAKGCFDQARNS